MRHHAPMLRIGLLVAVVVLLAAAAILFVVRPTVSVASAVTPGVTVECRGIGAEDECRNHGDSVLSQGPPSNTFEMDDVSRLVIERPLVGDAKRCSAAWYIERYPDDPVWEADVACDVHGG